MAMRTAGRVQWAFTGAAALVAVAGGILFFRLPVRDPGSATPRQPPAPVQMARPTAADVVLKDEAMIRDLRPLFLPTAHNAALPEPKREPGRTLLDDERPRLEFPEGELVIARGLPPVAVVNGQPADKARPLDVVNVGGFEVGTIGIGRRERVVDPVPSRGAFVEVVALATGRQVLAESLPSDLGPPAGRSWEPMELVAAVDAAGLAAPLAVTEGSRVDEVDAHFRKILAQNFRIGERLRPGFYRVVVGP